MTGLPHERRPRTWPASPRARRRGSSSDRKSSKLHRPRHALAAFRRADPERGWLSGWEGYWGFIAGCLHFEGKYREALDAAREARAPLPPSVYQIDYEVRQLAALGMTDSLRARLEESLTLPPGLWARGAVYLDAVQELAAHGHPGRGATDPE